MTETSFSPTRRSLLVAAAAAAAAALIPAKSRAALADEAIRPFRVNVPEAALVDLRRRIAATAGPTASWSPTSPRA